MNSSNRAWVGRLARWARMQVARELEPDLLEHLEVPARHALAGALEGVERRVQLSGQASDPRVGLEQAASQQPAPRRRDRVEHPAAFSQLQLQVLDEVLAADRAACLSRGPCRIGAPVRAVVGGGCQRGGEAGVAVRDLEVADDRVRDRRDPTDVLDAGRGRRADYSGPSSASRHGTAVPRLNESSSTSLPGQMLILSLSG